VPERPFVRVLTVKPGAPLQGVILSDQLITVQTHYQPNPARNGMYQTQPHFTPANYCPGCLMGRPARLRGYLGLYFLGAQRCGVVIADLTSEAMRSCPELRPGGRTLRGRGLLLERDGRARNSPLRAALVQLAAPEVLPPCPDVMAELYRLWGYNTQDLGAGVIEVVGEVVNDRKARRERGQG
jgi:hypothetical protein